MQLTGSGNEARSACPQLDVDIEETKEEDKQDEQTVMQI